MTPAEALDLLAEAPHGPQPCIIEPTLTQAQAVDTFCRAMHEISPGTDLDATTEQRVYQITRNQRYPIIKPDPEATA
jgi:hypothetical protein